MNDRLIALRTQHDLSCHELARRTGVSDTTIRRLEDGVNTPTRTTCLKLADFFGVDVNWLFGEKMTAKVRIYADRTVQPVPPSIPLPTPRVGERRMEVQTKGGAFPGALGERTPQPCTVVQVHPKHLWYRVRFDANGCYECYKVPNLDPLSSKIK